MKPSIAELAAVTAVGLALAYAAKKTSVAEKAPLLAPALLYTLGFYVATKRPTGGYAQLSK
jgi:hypothetical protein